MEDLFRPLIFFAFVGLLILLRFDAARFGAAEYDDEEAGGGWRAALRRLGWYVAGILLIAMLYFLHPRPISVLNLELGDDRAGSLAVGLLFAAAGTTAALAFAWFRYARLRLPAVRYYPTAIANSLGTAIIDEATFRGVVLGLLIAFGWPPMLALAFQTILYGLATRLGAPGRSWAMLTFFLGVGAVAGWLTLETGGIGAAIVGHAITRFAVFIGTGHAGQVRPMGAEPGEEEYLEGSGPPAGWEVVQDGHLRSGTPTAPSRWSRS